MTDFDSTKGSQDTSQDTCLKDNTGDSPTPSQSVGLSPIKVYTVFAICAVLLAILDRLTKAWAIFNAADGLDFIPGFMSFFLVYNKGASFGSLQGATIFLVAISFIICLAILIYLLRFQKHRVYEIVGLAAIFAGAIGNAYDRVTAGQVTDFLQLEFMHFPVFNIADCCITVGAVLFFIFLLFDKNSPFAQVSNQNTNEPTKSNPNKTKEV